MAAFTGAGELAAALKDVDVVVIPAGVPRKPGMTRDDLFNINAGIVRTLIEAVADNCPNVSADADLPLIFVSWLVNKFD